MNKISIMSNYDETLRIILEETLDKIRERNNDILIVKGGIEYGTGNNT